VIDQPQQRVQRDHQVLGGMAERGWGRIINISSVNGVKGQFGQANYSAAKAGILGFTKAIAQEVARKGVTVNAIAPGYIGTDMVMAIKRRSASRSSRDSDQASGQAGRNRQAGGLPVLRSGWLYDRCDAELSMAACT
jgi:acetoacetyl-CoA reductase